MGVAGSLSERDKQSCYILPKQELESHLFSVVRRPISTLLHIVILLQRVIKGM